MDRDKKKYFDIVLAQLTFELRLVKQSFLKLKKQDEISENEVNQLRTRIHTVQLRAEEATKIIEQNKGE